MDFLSSSALPTEVVKVVISDSNVFESQTVNLRRLTAVIGSHGSGKSAFLHALATAFGDEPMTSMPPFLAGSDSIYNWHEELAGTFEVTVTTPQGELTRSVDLNQSNKLRQDVWLTKAEPGSPSLPEGWYASYCAFTTAATELDIFFQDIHPSSWKSRLDHSRPLKSDEVKRLNRILGRRYSGITEHTIVTGEKDYKAFAPVIEAVQEDRAIDSWKMSIGELWVHYLRWWLREEAGSLTLLDEPEAFVSHRGHGGLLDEICRQVLDRQQQLLLATHSPALIEGLPLANILVCVLGSTGKVRIEPAAGHSQLRDVVGMDVPLRTLVLVEDELAKSVLREILSMADVSLYRETEIVTAGGADEVVVGVRSLRSAERIRVFGVLDGDQRSRQSGKAWGHYDSAVLLFLPGHKAPEDELLNLDDERLQHVARDLACSPGALRVGLAGLAGIDHQMTLSLLASRLGRSVDAVLGAMMRSWLKSEQVAEQRDELVRRLRA